MKTVFLFFLTLAIPALAEISLPDEIYPLLAPHHFVDPFAQLGPTSTETRTLFEENVFPDGQRIRPILCYVGAGISQRSIQDPAIQSMACLAEWAHNASLLHDDVLDQSKTRRNKLTVYRLTSEAEAVLLGDKLLSRVVKKALQPRQGCYYRAHGCHRYDGGRGGNAASDKTTTTQL